MITDLLRESWDRLPPDMSLEMPFGILLDYCSATLSRLAGQNLVPSPKNDADTALSATSSYSVRSAEYARKLYLSVPGLVNVLLNYKICVYYQLPLHPTRYFEVPDKPGPEVYPSEAVEKAETLFAEAVALALAFYRLDAGAAEAAARLKASVPTELLDFVYTSKPDNYTWRGSDPDKIKRLGDSILGRGKPALIVGAAHGAIMAGLVLSLVLGVPVWFLRFSMFKRNDRGPVLTPQDSRLLAAYRGADVLALDEDSASGQTLGIMSEKLADLGLCLRTGAVIRHGASRFKPDHAGFVWWE